MPDHKHGLGTGDHWHGGKDLVVTALRLAALRFYIKTLKKTWSIAETPYPKMAIHLPTILSKDEVELRP